MSSVAYYCGTGFNLPNATHSNLLHLLNNDLPIFEELCHSCLQCVYKCFSHSLRLVQFASVVSAELASSDDRQ